MNIHKNARLTLIRRLEMVHDVVDRKLTFAAASAAHGVRCLPYVSGSVGTWCRVNRACVMPPRGHG